MNKEEIIKALESCGFKKDNAATKKNHYSVTKRKSLTKQQVENRNSTGWGKGEYIIAEYSEDCHDFDKIIDGWKRLTAKYKNQYLILEIEKGNWKVYDSNCNVLGDHDYIKEAFAGIKKSAEPMQKIFFGCPGTGKSFRVNQIVEENAEGRFHRFIKHLKFIPNTKYKALETSTIKKYVDVPNNLWVVEIAKEVEAKDAIKSDKAAKDINTVYDITDPDTVALIRDLAAQTDTDIIGKKMYSTALDYYYQMLKVNTVFRTTFHPDTDYASFVGCYKPRMSKTGTIEYSFCPQVFTDAYVTAWQNPYMPIYLVIEEINRGNCAQIFGDLFQLLDRKNGYSEYPIKADNDLADHLEDRLGIGKDGIVKRELCLPPNLYIYATMNTSDQSLFPMDSAFKRRWDWEYVQIDPECEESIFSIDINGRKYSWPDFLTKVNARITELTDSEDKMLGNFFIKDDIEENEFKSKVMFYLWSEVCKDYVHADTFFKTLRTKDGEEEFTFSQLYGKDASEILEGFMKYLEISEAVKVTENEQNDDSADDDDSSNM